MKHFLFCLSIFYSESTFAADYSKFFTPHSRWTDVIKTYKHSETQFSYKQLKYDSKSNPEHPFNLYLSDLKSLKAESFDSMSREEQMAFLLNAYNAFVVKIVIDHYPLKSIRSIGGLLTGGPWKMKLFSLLEGKIQTLDQIEHEWLRPKYRDVRIHAALNCASASSPPLHDEAFEGKQLDNQLEIQMRKWLHNSRLNHFDSTKRIASLSEVFSWYSEDFTVRGSTLKSIMLRFGPVKSDFVNADDLKIEYLTFDWDLNDKP